MSFSKTPSFLLSSVERVYDCLKYNCELPGINTGGFFARNPREMTANLTVARVPCSPSVFGSFTISLLFVVLPIHMLVVKVLLVNIRLEMPRHIILFSLSLSDCLQILVSAVCMSCLKALDVTTDALMCRTFRTVMQVNGASTLVVSSFTLVSLSIERYIVCTYCYRFREIVTKNRAVYAQTLILIAGTVAGGVTAYSSSQGETTPGKMFSLSKDSFLFLFVIVTFTVSFVLTIVQVRLFCISRAKMLPVAPGTSYAVHRHRAVMRKRQLRVTFVASTVVVAYLLCMIPFSCLILIDKFIRKEASPLFLQRLLTSLAMVNNLVDPLIYGLGIVDTRQAMKRELARIKAFVLTILGASLS